MLCTESRGTLIKQQNMYTKTEWLFKQNKLEDLIKADGKNLKKTVQHHIDAWFKNHDHDLLWLEDFDSLKEAMQKKSNLFGPGTVELDLYKNDQEIKDEYKKSLQKQPFGIVQRAFTDFKVGNICQCRIYEQLVTVVTVFAESRFRT